MKLDARIAERLGVIEGTLEVISVVDCTFIPANLSGKGVRFRYRHDAGHGVIPAEDLAPLECFEGNDPAGYVTPAPGHPGLSCSDERPRPRRVRAAHQHLPHLAERLAGSALVPLSGQGRNRPAPFQHPRRPAR
jgi:hypothetical protein